MTSDQQSGSHNNRWSWVAKQIFSHTVRLTIVIVLLLSLLTMFAVVEEHNDEQSNEELGEAITIAESYGYHITVLDWIPLVLLAWAYAPVVRLTFELFGVVDFYRRAHDG